MIRPSSKAQVGAHVHGAIRHAVLGDRHAVGGEARFRRGCGGGEGMAGHLASPLSPNPGSLEISILFACLAKIHISIVCRDQFPTNAREKPLHSVPVSVYALDYAKEHS